MGKGVTEVIPGIREASPELFEAYGRVALSGKPEEFEFDFKSMRLWLCISVYSPRRGYFVAVFDNITERKRAEERLRTSHERLKLAQQAANAGLWDWDVLTGKLTWSEELYKLFGMPPAAEALVRRVAGRRTP